MQFGQVGQFFKGLATNFVTKVSQVFGDLLVYFEKRHYIVKNCCGYYLGNLGPGNQLANSPRSQFGNCPCAWFSVPSLVAGYLLYF